MSELIFLMIGLALGSAGGAWAVRALWPAGGASGDGIAERAADQARLSEARRTVEELRARVDGLTAERDTAQEGRIRAETRFVEAEKHFSEQRALLESAEKRMGEMFEMLAVRALRQNNEQFAQQAADQVRPLGEALKTYQSRMAEVEKSLKQDYGGLKEQLASLAATHRDLAERTTTLSTALRAPQVKGRWGEITLRRAVEAAGLNPHCDFSEQAATDNGDSRVRPDLVVHLPGERTIVVDAKAPTSAYLNAIEATSEEVRARELASHARAIRQHMLSLSGREYQRHFRSTPDFVVMFVPGEAFFSAALEADRELIEEGIRMNVILASPTTLIALLQGVAYSWRQQNMVKHAQEIGDQARELVERVYTFAGHLAGIRGGLQGAADAFNGAVSSWHARVIPAGRRMAELGVRGKNEAAANLGLVEAQLRDAPSVPGSDDDGDNGEDSSSAGTLFQEEDSDSSGRGASQARVR